MKGRPSKKLLEQYNCDFSQLKSYFEINKKNEIEIETKNEPKIEKQKNEIVVINNNNENSGNNTIVNNDISNTNVIQITPQKLCKADVIISSALESGLSFVGIEKEIKVMTPKEAEALIEVMPDIKLQKSWANFFLLYLMSKL